MITRRQLRGAEIFASQLSKEFTSRGHNVIIVGIQSPRTFPYEPEIEYTDLGAKGDRLNRFLSFNTWKKFADLVSEWKPDIIQANASETLKLTVLSRLLFRWKVPIVYRNANKVSDFLQSFTSKLFNTVLTHNVDFVISVSEICRQDFVATFKTDQSKTITIPIGTFVPPVIPNLTDKLSDPYWINVGSLVKEKNHAGLLHIYKRYINKGGREQLVIVGDGPEKENLLRISKELCLENLVRFLGYRQDVIALIGRSKGLLLPSLIEGLPGVILESMACKVPVFAYGVGGIPEVINHYETGVLVKRNDEETFADEMLSLGNDLYKRNAIIEKAYKLCFENFRIETIAERFLEQYDKILKA